MQLQLATMLAQELRELLGNLEIHVKDHDQNGSPVPSIYVVANPFVSTQRSAYVAFWTDRVELAFRHHSSVVWTAYENRTDRLRLEYENTYCIPWIITSLRRHFCLEWGSELRPWEGTTSGASR